VLFVIYKLSLNNNNNNNNNYSAPIVCISLVSVPDVPLFVLVVIQ